MNRKSLSSLNNELADKETQLRILSNGIFQDNQLPAFAQKLKESEQFPLKPGKPGILQINLGYMCNQVCAHCHVDAGPDRKEIMNRNTMLQCLDVIRKTGAHTLDLTGGAPEMNPNFRWFVEQASMAGIKDLIVRSNLTIMLANKKYHDLPFFFREYGVHIISSLPFYKPGPTNRQRGEGVFKKSIEALKMLNHVGYGQADGKLVLDLVHNPAGAFLPLKQASLEREFKTALKRDHNIDFNNLFVITNLPVSRFLDYLIATGNYEDYMRSLVDAFNPAAVNNLMCRNTISVGWDGYLYDCDFNQMLGLKLSSPIQHISEYDEEILEKRNIMTSQHCYGCTAGAGSSCQGVLT